MLDWLYTAISWVMARWHSLWNIVFGDPPAESGLAGLTWVLAIVFLVVTIRVILFPLFVKQIKSSGPCRSSSRRWPSCASSTAATGRA